jgi:putative glutamine amidotransferase
MRAPARPLIAVTTSEVRQPVASDATTAADPQRTEMVLGMRYLEAVEAAGGVPIVVPPMGPAAVATLIDGVSGLCLSGGPDIDPSAYGAEPHPQLGPTELRLDRFELDVIRQADARGLPILAICRGAQMFNVARGGTLHQHVPDVARDGIDHRQSEPGDQTTHPVRVAPGSMLASILGKHEIDVNSFHHQAVDVLGRGLRPCAWAPDGLLEGFEAVDRRFAVAVQWHAESLADHPGHERLFRAFAQACAATRGVGSVGASLAPAARS